MVIPCLFIDPAQGSTVKVAQSVKDASGSMNVLGMFTVADFPLLFSKAHLMALIVFTIIFALGVIQAGEKGKKITSAMEAMTAVVVNIIGIVMKLAPLGLGCYFAILIGTNGSEVIAPL